MRIEQLEYLTAVTRQGSLRRASDHLHLSQPALSEAISKLERELGVTLLDRRRSGARISRGGQELLPRMQEVLDAVDRLRSAAGDVGSTRRQVRIGTVHGATSGLLAPALQALATRHPGTSAEVLTLRQSEIDDGLVDGSIDLGLVNVLAGDAGDADLVDLSLVDTTLVRGRPVVVLPPAHPLAAHAEVTVAQLREEPWVTMRPGYLMHRFTARLFGADQPAIRHAADGAEMGKALVAAGVGVTVLPDYSVAGDALHTSGRLLTRPIAEDRTRVDLALRRRRTAPASQAARDLLQALVDVARGGPPSS